MLVAMMIVMLVLLLVELLVDKKEMILSVVLTELLKVE